MESQCLNIMDYSIHIIQLRKLLYFYILMKFIVQQLDHYLYMWTIRIMKNLWQNSQKQRKQKGV